MKNLSIKVDPADVRNVVMKHHTEAEMIFRKAIRRSGFIDQNRIEDIVQEIWVRLLDNNFWNYDGSSAISTHLYGYAMMVARNIRRESKETRKTTQADIKALSVTALSKEPDPEYPLLLEEIRKDMQGHPDPIVKALLVGLYGNEPKSIRDIAEQVGYSYEIVRRKHRRYLEQKKFELIVV